MINDMKKEVFATGSDAEVAVNNAMLALGAASLDEITYTIEDLGSKGIFGIGARPTKVRAWIELPDEEPARKTSARKSEDQEEKGEKSHSGNRQRRNRSGRRDGMRPPRDFVPPAELSKPKEAVIPESELK
ncbi:MAG: Jag N-terminal domain-containing protein, partial [Clostridia bacterium]|nr:Jag N-terminal domain-containing protein [Clostridia bacterium]